MVYHKCKHSVGVHVVYASTCHISQNTEWFESLRLKSKIKYVQVRSQTRANAVLKNFRLFKWLRPRE